MRKEKHYIALYAGKGQKTYKLVDGYTETVDGVALGFRKNGCGWVVTDILTGMAIGVLENTRKEALEKAKGYTKALKECHESKNGYAAWQDLEEFKFNHAV